MVLLEVGKEVGTSASATNEVLKDRGLETKAQVHKTCEVDSRDEEVAQVID